MTQDEQHLDSSQQSSSQINQRSNSVENNQIIIDDDTINTSSSKIATTIDRKLNQNTEIENFNKNNNNNNATENENSGDDSFEQSSASTTTTSINDFNDNIVEPIPENKNKINNDNTVVGNISNKPDNNVVIISEKQNAVNSQLLNENETNIKLNHNNIVSLHIQEEDCLPNNTNIILVDQSTSSTSSLSSNKETTSNCESNELKQIESRDTLNKTVLPIETADDSKIQNTEKLLKQTTLINDYKNNSIKANNNKSNETILNNNLENNKNLQIIREDKIIEEANNKIVKNKTELNEFLVANDSSDGGDNTNSFKVLNNNDKLTAINLNDNLITNNTSDNDKNNKSDLNLNKESQEKNQLNVINAKNNEVNENKKEAQGIKNSQNQQLNINEEQLKNNLNFNELKTNKLFDDNSEIKSLNKNNLIDGQIDNKNNNNNNNNSTKTIASKYKFNKQKTLSQDEDPIVRLNRLRANISNVLREVKGVIRQYSSEQSIEIEDKYIGGNSSTSKRASNTTTVANSRRQHLQKTENVNEIAEIEEEINEEMAPVADDNKPVKFRFVRKTRRNSNQSDAENQSIQIEESINRNNLDTNELSHENLNNNLNENQTKNNKETIKNNNNNIESDLENNKTILESDNNIKKEQINENINKEINSSTESQKDNLKSNNLIIKDNLIEKETDEKVKKKVDSQSSTKELTKNSAESAEKKVKKFIVKKTSVATSENNSTDKNIHSVAVHKTEIKPKIVKKLQKVSSLDKEEPNAPVNEKLKRPIFRKQISLDEKLAKEQQQQLLDNTTNKLSDIKELLIGTEVIPIIKPSTNISKITKELNATSSKTKTNNLIHKNSKSLSKSKEEEKPQTDLNLVTNNDKLLKVSNQSESTHPESDDFTILRSREVIVSKVIVPQGSLEFDNPELIEFDKGDCSKITEIRSADNSTDSIDTKKLKLLKSMTISENSLKIDRRASIATTDAKKIEGEYKQKIGTDDTMQQRRLSHSGNLKTVQLIKTDATLTKTAIPNQNTKLPKKEVIVEANEEKKQTTVKQIVNASVTPVVPQKTLTNHTIDATKCPPTKSEVLVKKPYEKDVKSTTVIPKETIDKVSSSIQQKKIVTSSTSKNTETKIVTTKEPIVQKVTVETKKPKVPKTFVVTKAKDDHPPPHLIPVKVATSPNNIPKEVISHSKTSNDHKEAHVIGTTKIISSTNSAIASNITSIKNIEIAAPVTTQKQISNKESLQQKELVQKHEVEVKTVQTTVSTTNSTNLQKHESAVNQQTDTKLIPKNESKEQELVSNEEQKSSTPILNTSTILTTINIEEINQNQVNAANQENKSPSETLSSISEEIISSGGDSLNSNTKVFQTSIIEEKGETFTKTEVKDQIENEVITNEYLAENTKCESSHSENETTEDDHFESESTTETTDTDTGKEHKTKTVKKRRAFKKVVIKRIKRRLSVSDGPRPISPTTVEEPEICEKEIYVDDTHSKSEEENEEDELENEQEEEIHKGPKPCIRPRAFEIDEPVLYGERYKKTQIKWRKARIVERITSISYKIHFGEDEEDKSVHLSYLKRDNGKKISFGGKEYLEIDYAQIEAEEEKYSRPYSIWDRA